MGQKVNPIGIRLGVIKDWNSKWYAKPQEYAQTLIKDLDIRHYLQRRLKNASVGKIVIERTTQNVLIKVHSARPGVIIGKKGDDIDKLRQEVAKRLGVPVHINIEEIRRPELDAKLTAENIAQQLERRIMFRRAMKRAVQDALRVGAKGVKVKVSGRLGGAEIARSEWYREGRVPLHTLRADIDYGVAEALTTYGIIGVKVWIFKGEILSNQGVEEKADIVDLVTQAPKKLRVKKAVNKSKTLESEDKVTETKKVAVVKKKKMTVNKESTVLDEQGDIEKEEPKFTTYAEKTLAETKVDKTTGGNVDSDNSA